MSRWNDTYRIRREQNARDIEALVAEINKRLLDLPIRYRLEVDQNGRKLTLKQ